MTSFDPKATALRMEQLLSAMHKSGCRWDVRLHQALLSALRNLLPLTDGDNRPIAIKDLQKSEKLLAEIARSLPAELCTRRRVWETVTNLRYARVFVDEHGQPITDVRIPPKGINENVDELRANLIVQAIRHAAAVEGGISPADARPLALIVFGKGRPDFPALVKQVEDAITARKP